MNVLLLVVALATPVDAPKADLPTVAAASAAVTAVTVVGEVAPVSAAVPAVAVVDEVPATSAAVAAVTVVGEVPAMTAAVSPAVRICPFAAAVAGCAPVDLFRGDAGFLSGPWGAVWRLEAAKRRGDEEAARHLETTLDALLGEAVGGGE